jgi:hypothetical protein
MPQSHAPSSQQVSPRVGPSPHFLALRRQPLPQSAHRSPSLLRAPPHSHALRGAAVNLVQVGALLLWAKYRQHVPRVSAYAACGTAVALRASTAAGPPLRLAVRLFRIEGCRTGSQASFGCRASWCICMLFKSGACCLQMWHWYLRANGGRGKAGAIAATLRRCQRAGTSQGVAPYFAWPALPPSRSDNPSFPPPMLVVAACVCKDPCR